MKDALTLPVLAAALAMVISLASGALSIRSTYKADWKEELETRFKPASCQSARRAGGEGGAWVKSNMTTKHKSAQWAEANRGDDN